MSDTVAYTDLQFIGYAIPSIPLQFADIGSGASYIEGRYIGIDPPQADIDARIALAMNAIERTLQSEEVDRSESTLKIFMMPEFSFRGPRGAYANDPPDIDYFRYFRTEFAKRVASPEYQGWLFVVGTTVDAIRYVCGTDVQLDQEAKVRENLAIALADAWQYCSTNHDTELAGYISNTMNSFTKYCHANPIYEIADKSYVVAGGSPDARYPEGLSIRKKFISNEDFVLNAFTDAFTEEACAYPPINEHYGENKRWAFDVYSIFTFHGIKFGLEVCLDHGCARLRTNRRPDTELVQVHLVPSCGMQIRQSSIIAGPEGLVFNCDGQYGGIGSGAQPGLNESIWTGEDSQKAHTQLTKVVTPCGAGPSSSNAVLTKPDATVTTVPIDDPSASKIFAYGPGEVHIYTPLPVPPPLLNEHPC